MKTSINIFPFCILIFILNYCENNQLQKEIEVINQTFLSVADTVAYHELSLRPAPPHPYDSVPVNKPIPKNLTIVVPDTLYPIQNWADQLAWFCNSSSIFSKDSLKELQELFCKELELGQKPETFDINWINDIGKYTLINEKTSIDTALIIVGKIQFSKVTLNSSGSLAAFVARISKGQKSGIEKLFILSKKSGKWEVKQVENLLVW